MKKINSVKEFLEMDNKDQTDIFKEIAEKACEMQNEITRKSK